MNYTVNLKVLYGIRFFSALIPAYVIERLYWEQRGMTIPMVIYAEIVYALTVVLLEVPSGVLSDRWGRKKMLVASAILICCEFLILLFATEFWHFAVAVFLAGLARSASSGSENALLYDSLLRQGEAASFEKRLGRLNACDFVSAMLAALCGSLLAGRFGLELNYWISLGSALAALLLTLLLVEPAVKADDQPVPVEAESAGEAIPFKRYITDSLRFFRQNPGVSLVICSGMVTGTAMVYIYEFWQLYVDRLGMPLAYFGALSASIMLLQLPGSLLAHALIARFSPQTLIITVLAVQATGFSYAAVNQDYTGLAAMLLTCLFAGIMEPLASGYLHHRIDSGKRATMDSFQSLGEKLVTILAGLGFGYLSVRYDVFGGYGFMAVMCGVFLIGFIAASRKIIR
ncbi:MFS transporter [Paenibacillus oralis]|uniref:MFS transporter n=1 Tax=Paenibacillus oralis TaxID=2490856 RepID=A0A3P3U8U2_9BACL|nr:MFS transporter [Paenibacillus oralis]RRJ66126.1 MFS transporter [Paenibacillus oralis]